jgi:hypothetical protein
VIQKGKFFDLQYAQNTSYPKDKVYAYLRYTENERNLIICNFDTVIHDFSIEIPTLALDMMGLKNYQLKELHTFLPPASKAATLSENRIQIPANATLVLKLNKP